jgi:glycosyltransferase involved in cell wall biosynthesis
MDEMNPTRFLSIVIPTYNRAAFLDLSFEAHVPLARLHNIQIFVSDNASTDNTKEVVDKWKNEYPLISYYCNETNLGPEDNIERALKYPDTEYVWLLGDTYRIPSDEIDYVYNLITNRSKEYDVILLNVGDELKHINTQDYSDQNILLHDMFWLMTCLSTLVYSSKVIRNANFERYRNTSFIQTGIIFEYIAGRDFVIHWNRSQSVRRVLSTGGVRKDLWSHDRLFEIWIEQRSNLILSLPASYSIKTKLDAILYSSNMAGIKSLLMLRYRNILNITVYRNHTNLLLLNTEHSRSVVMFISLLPRFIVKCGAVIGILLSRKNKLDRIKKVVRNEV